MHVICISDIHFIYTKLTHEANELGNYILKLILWTKYMKYLKLEIGLFVSNNIRINILIYL